MKNIVVITDGIDLRVFRLRGTRGGEGGAEPDREELPVTRGIPSCDSAPFSEYLALGEGVAFAGEDTGSPDPKKPERVKYSGDIDEKDVWYIAQRLERLIREEKPDLWKLMAPADIANEIRNAISKSSMEALADD